MLKAPFPYFGGKSRIADQVWPRFGNVRNYVEPFVGSAAMLLLRPRPFEGVETINDKCGFVANFWRAMQASPRRVARHADRPVNENDLHARHIWLVERAADLQAKLEGDPNYFDAEIAGVWVWGICCWIGSGFCSGQGPWRSVRSADGSRQLVHLGDAGRGVNRQLIHLGNAGRGVNRKRVHLGDAGRGVNRQRVHLGDAGRGVNRQRVHLGDAGQGGAGLVAWFRALAERLRLVRICSGDWSRICTPTVVEKYKPPCAIFLDPPYADTADRTGQLYRRDDLTVAHQVREWAIRHGNNPHLRIALCGYEGEHKMPRAWSCLEWKTAGGYGSQVKGSRGAANAARERIWFSPHCLPAVDDAASVVPSRRAA